MALAVRGLGLPWVHTDVACDRCHVSPIEGYRYKCESCSSEHNLCEKCHRQGQPHVGHRFVQIARDSKEYHPPFQVYYVVCSECGEAPIEGRCHRHRWRPNFNLCETCFFRLPPSMNLSLEWDVLDEPKIPTICRTHTPAYHFHRRCGSCGESPITGPRFDLISHPDWSLCLVCFDQKFVKGLVKNVEYRRFDRPEPHKVRHVFMYACRNCGEAPISGPAYVNKRVPDRVLCLLCYMNIQQEAQIEFSRVDPPSQFGNPTLLALPGPATGTVTMEEFSELADEFQRYREEKEAAARVVASNLLSQSDKFQQLQEKLEEAQRVSAGGSTVARELEASKAKNEELTRMLADHQSLVQEVERMRVEKEEMSRASGDYSILSGKLERLMVEKEEDMRAIAEHRSLAEESKRLKEEMEELVLSTATEHSSLKKEMEEAAVATSIKHSNLIKEMEEAACAQAEEYATLSQENTRLLAEKEEAAEYASLARELETMEGQEKASAEYLLVVQEVDKLKKENADLVQEFEKLKVDAEATAGLRADEYGSLSKEFELYKTNKDQAVTDHSRIAKEKDMLLQEKESQVILVAEKLADVTRELELLKDQSQDYEDLVQKCEKLTADKAWLVQQVENVYEEKESASKGWEQTVEARDAELRAHVEDHANLTREFAKLKVERDTILFLRDNLVQEFDKLEKEKEELESSTADYSRVVKELERLKEERETVIKTREFDHLNLIEEYEQLKVEKEQAVRTREAQHTSLSEDFERFKMEKEQAVRELEEKYMKSTKESEKLLGTREDIARMNASMSVKLEELEKQKAQLQETARVGGEDFSSLQQKYGKLLDEKEAAVLFSANLSLELQKLEAESTAVYSSLAKEFESFQKDPGESFIINTPQYRRLLRDFEKIKKKSADELAQILEELGALSKAYDEMEKTSGEENASLTQEKEKLQTEMEEARRKSGEELSRSREELSKLRDELENLKSTFAFDLAGIGRCAQVAICTYGATIYQKKAAFELGYSRSTSGKPDKKTLDEADKFLKEAVQSLDEQYADFKHDVEKIKDAEAKDFYLSTALPSHEKEMKVNAATSNLLELRMLKKQYYK